MDDVHDLTPLYLGDALDEHDRRRYEEHLPGCLPCRTRLDVVDDASSGYPLGEETAPESIQADATADASSPPARRRLAGLGAGVAAAAAAISVVVAAVIGGEPDIVEQVYAADDVVVFDVDAATGEALQVVYSPEVGRVVFVADGLADPGPGSLYQLWLISDDGPRTAGTFVPREGQATVVLEGTTEPGLAVGLSVEPRGGSARPSGDLLFTQPLSQ